MIWLKAEFVPQLNDEEDTSYFDARADRYCHDVAADDTDEPLDAEAPLFGSFSSCSPRYKKSHGLFLLNDDAVAAKDEEAKDDASSTPTTPLAPATGSYLDFSLSFTCWFWVFNWLVNFVMVLFIFLVLFFFYLLFMIYVWLIHFFHDLFIIYYLCLVIDTFLWSFLFVIVYSVFIYHIDYHFDVVCIFIFYLLCIHYFYYWIASLYWLIIYYLIPLLYCLLN